MHTENNHLNLKTIHEENRQKNIEHKLFQKVNYQGNSNFYVNHQQLNLNYFNPIPSTQNYE